MCLIVRCRSNTCSSTEDVLTVLMISTYRAPGLFFSFFSQYCWIKSLKNSPRYIFLVQKILLTQQNNLSKSLYYFCFQITFDFCFQKNWFEKHWKMHLYEVIGYGWKVEKSTLYYLGVFFVCEKRSANFLCLFISSISFLIKLLDFIGLTKFHQFSSAVCDVHTKGGNTNRLCMTWKWQKIEDLMYMSVAWCCIYQ